ncbi:MAG: galactose oxidase [Pseudomonadota bacterium]
MPLPPLPEALANNAVAAVETDKGTYLVSFSGLAAGKTWRDTRATTYVLAPEASQWERGEDVPGDTGRLASVAVAVGDAAYVFGGYTVAEDHSEVSLPYVHQFDPRTRRFSPRVPMPVPVDDAVAVAYQDRYIYLISGWHDTANVNLVQRYDTLEDRWVQATAYPGAPVFGHAGGIVNGTLVICGGVAIDTKQSGPREFVANTACYAGTLRADNARRIDWRAIAPMPGPARYRMAAAGSAELGGVVFMGGGDNPYNYDGIGYNGEPSNPVGEVYYYDLEQDRWRALGRQRVPSMDHRGLLGVNGGFVVVGGMDGEQQVTGSVRRYLISAQ